MKQLYIIFIDWKTGEVCHRFLDHEWDWMSKNEKEVFTKNGKYLIKWECINETND